MGGIGGFCELFRLVVAFGCFVVGFGVCFFLLLLFIWLVGVFSIRSLEWPGKGCGGRTQHSQRALDTGQFIYLNNKHPACQKSSDRGQFLNGMRQYVF